MVESVIAVVFIAFLMTISLVLVRMVTARAMLSHAAARAARAKAVGFNDFMCFKTARAAMIPVSGRRTWPQGGTDELYRVPLYLESENAAIARAILDYEYWDSTDFDFKTTYGLSPVASASLRMQTDDFTMDGDWEVESHAPYYMDMTE